MLEHINIENILFLDIETVPAYYRYDDMPEALQALWDKKAGYLTKNGEKTTEEVYERAGIYAEFGKIICISAGYVKRSGNGNEIKIKSFYSDDERVLLAEFIDLLNSYYSQPQHLLCAHNGKEFDYPYLARRILVNGLRLPALLNIAGKKPWEVGLLDTMELWKFGDYKSFTSLNLLTNIFNIPTPKDDINGSDVARVYWEDKDLQRIVSYCQKDVVAIAQLMMRFKGEPLIEAGNINFIE